MTSQEVSTPDRIDHLTPKSHNSGDTAGLTTTCTTLVRFLLFLQVTISCVNTVTVYTLPSHGNNFLH